MVSPLPPPPPIPPPLKWKVLWLCLLFGAIGIAASDFFCPNLATLSHSLRMSESMAGVTFLALGNGSPDLFSTFAAMRVGSGSLAIGELIGAAFFITSVVAGSMAIVNPFKVSRKSFLRDAIFFSGAVGFSVCLLADGKITTWETSAMIAYYVLYVVLVVMATWYWRKRSNRRRQESRARFNFARPEEERVEEDDEEGPTAQESTALIGDVRDLENAIDDEGEDEPELEQEYANIQHRMSIVRPTFETRLSSHHIHSNIRPSLFGALEVYNPPPHPTTSDVGNLNSCSSVRCRRNWDPRQRCQDDIDTTPWPAQPLVKLPWPITSATLSPVPPPSNERPGAPRK
jgi:solute carrier family 24 (sodium/potassium/calcium exchanger), member 6